MGLVRFALKFPYTLRRRIAGIADAHLQQELDAPAFMVNIDPSRALQLGLSAQAIANNVNTSLSSSEQVAPNFWTDPASGIPYFIAVQTPEHQVSSVDELDNTPVSTALAAIGPPIPGLFATPTTLLAGPYLFAVLRNRSVAAFGVFEEPPDE
jgi:multidrug efflux pump subunit AcrB